MKNTEMFTKKISRHFIVLFANKIKTVKKGLILFNNNYPKDNKTRTLQSKLSLSYFILLPAIASVGAVKTGMSPADVASSVEMVVDYKLQPMPDVTHNIPHMHSVGNLVEPAIGVCNNIAPVVAGKQGVFDLVYWPDVQSKADFLSLKNIKMIPQQLSGYSGNIMSPDLYNYGQTTHNGANSFFHNLPHRSRHYHPYIKSVYLISVIPAFIFSIRVLFIVSSDIIYSMFVQTYSWFTQIFWEKIKTLINSTTTTTTGVGGSAGRDRTRTIYRSRRWNISSANNWSNNNNGNSGDGNGDGGPNRSLNFYEEIPGTLKGLIRCIRDIIRALVAIQRLIAHILSNRPISLRLMASIMNAIDGAAPAFYTNFWLGHGDYNFMNITLMSTLSVLALESVIFAIIQGDVTMMNYTMEYGAAELDELMNLSPQSIAGLHMVEPQLTPIITELCMILINLYQRNF